jgi:flagellar assembly protein FliH
MTNRIYKAGTVQVDSAHPVVIEVAQSLFPNMSALPDSLDLDASESAGPGAEEIASNIIGAANYQARQIKESASTEAAMIKITAQQQAESEAARIRTEAQEQGYSEGFATATQEGDAIKDQARQLLASTQSQCKAMQEKLEPEIVNLIIQITSKLLGDAVAINPDIVMNLVKQGMASATITGDVTVHVSSQDFEHVTAHKDEIMALTDGSVKLEIVRDLGLSPMDCVIETPFGNIDCSLDQQFEQLRSNLTYILNT